MTNGANILKCHNSSYKAKLLTLAHPPHVVSKQTTKTKKVNEKIINKIEDVNTF